MFLEPGDRIRFGERIGIIELVTNDPAERGPFVTGKKYWVRFRGAIGHEILERDQIQKHPILRGFKILKGAGGEYLRIFVYHGDVDVWEDGQSTNKLTVASLSSEAVEALKYRVRSMDAGILDRRPGVFVQGSDWEIERPLALEQWNFLRGL